MVSISPRYLTLTSHEPAEELEPLLPAKRSEDSRRGDVAGKWIKSVAAVLTIAPLAYAHRETLQAISNVAWDPFFSTWGLVSTVNAFRNCMESGFVSMDAMRGVASGLSAAAGFDRIAMKALGVGLGVANYGAVIGGFGTLVKVVTKVQQGDVPGALLSGTKLVAMIALTGHPVAFGIVAAADLAYMFYGVVNSDLADKLYGVFYSDASQPEPDTDGQFQRI